MERYSLPADGDAVFPYSQAVRDGDLIFVAGQLASDSSDWHGPAGDIEAETRAAMDRIGAILAQAGASFADVLKVTIFMTDLTLFARMNAVYASYFPDGLPARTTVGVASLLNDGMIEIECIARRRRP
jgi:2-iminobutanoate/2-iminopropanoate deaminase